MFVKATISRLLWAIMYGINKKTSTDVTKYLMEILNQNLFRKTESFNQINKTGIISQFVIFITRLNKS